MNAAIEKSYFMDCQAASEDCILVTSTGIKLINVHVDITMMYFGHILI